MKSRLYLVFLILILVSSKNLFSQVDEFGTNFLIKKFTKPDSFENENVKKLFLNIENSNFFKNNEYFSNFNKGHTLIGFYLRPELQYMPAKNVRISAGLHMLKYSGMDKFSQFVPSFNIELKIGRRLELIMGSLSGNLQHGLPEPLYQYERFYKSNLENGIQLLYNSNYVKSDLWLDWQKFINNGDPFQESFIIGNSTRINILNLNNSLYLDIPLYLIVSHKGGQIDVSGENVQTLVNFSTGIEAVKKLNHNFFTGVVFRGLYYNFRDISHNPYLNYKRGWAGQIKLGVRTRIFDFSMAYWNSYKFFASLGEPLFFSFLNENSSFDEPQREIVSSRIVYEKMIYDFLFAGLRYEHYYDIRNNKRDFSFGLYIIFKNQNFLKKLN